MKVRRFFARKGGAVLYADAEREDRIPPDIRSAFRQAPCGGGDIGLFPEKVKKPVAETGYFVDEGK